MGDKLGELFIKFWSDCYGYPVMVSGSSLFSVCKESEGLVLSLLGTPNQLIYHQVGMSSQVLALLSDTGRRGQTPLSAPKHSQTSQDAVKTPPRGPQDAQEAQEAPKIAPRPPR